MMSVLQGMGGVVWTSAFFILALGIIVFVHEYGHYIVGRWSGIHAEVFSLGFGPVLFTRTDRRGTRWQVALVPLGGYVKFLGDSDAASTGTDAAAMAGLSAEERRHTMAGAPLWARSATVFAGPLFNFILAIVVFTGMILWFGIATDRPVVGTVATLPGQAQPFQPGDRIVSVNGIATPDWETYLKTASELPGGATFTYVIDRAGAEISLEGAHPMPPLVSSVQLKSAAYDAGIQEGDVVLEADGKPVTAFMELPPIVEGLAGAAVPLKIWRPSASGGDVLEMSITPNRRDIPNADGGFDTRWLIGLSGGLMFDPEVRQPGPWEALTLAAERSWFAGYSSLSGLWHVITGDISPCNISGPIGMAQVMGQAASQGLEYYISMLAIMSLGIGLINLFPIPVLDGGHLVFHAYEAIFRRPPPEGALRVLMTVGLFVVLTFMAYALTNDITCK